MPIHDYWFLPRNIRKLNSIPDYISIFNDMVVGKNWSHEKNGLQLLVENEFHSRQLRICGNLRARELEQGGGGVRTAFGLAKCLGFLYEDGDEKIVRLTIAGEELLAGNQSFVEIMRDRLLKFQYPAYYFNTGKSKVASDFKIHPFWFLLKLLANEDIKYLTRQEIARIVVVYAKSNTDNCYKQVVAKILEYRTFRENHPDFDRRKPNDLLLEEEILGYTYADKGLSIRYDASGKVTSDKALDVTESVLAWLESTLYISRTHGKVKLNPVFKDEVLNIISTYPRMLSSAQASNYVSFQRAYGCDKYHSKDLRRFDIESRNEETIRNNRIRGALIRLSMENIITEITPELINTISMETGISSDIVESVVRSAFPRGVPIDGFLIRFKEMAKSSREEAIDFEKATRDIFDYIFNFKADHIGQKRDSSGVGGYPDVFIESETFSGLIDNKAYKSYSISADHKLRMQNYVSKFQDTTPPLSFFLYIADGYKKNISEQIEEVHNLVKVNGSAITADQLVDMIFTHSRTPYSHEQLKSIFSVNRRIELSDYYIYE